MELIQKLQQTKNWSAFEKWLHQSDFSVDWHYKEYLKSNFLNLPIEFQKGVFEEFIRYNHDIFEVRYVGTTYSSDGYLYGMYVKKDNTVAWEEFPYEEFLLYYFNKEL